MKLTISYDGVYNKYYIWIKRHWWSFPEIAYSPGIGMLCFCCLFDARSCVRKIKSGEIQVTKRFVHFPNE